MTRISATAIAVAFIGGSTIAITAQTSQTDMAVLLLSDRSLAPGRMSRGLVAPAQAKLLPGGAGGGVDRYETEIELETNMAVVDIAAHYVAQITSAGWTAESRNTDAGTMAVARFGGKSATGDPATATLFVTALTNTRKEVVLRLIRNKSVVARPAAARGAAEPSRGTRPGGGGAGIRAAGPGVSSELMSVILDGPLAGGKPQAVRAGSAPDFPKELLPSESVIGVIAVSKSVTTIAAEASSFAMADIPRFVMTLGKLGWLGEPRMLGGFRNSVTQTIEVCRGTEFLNLSFHPRERPGVFVRAALTKSEGRPCIGEPGLTRNPSGRASGWGIDAARPLLVGPRDAAQSGSSSGGGANTSNSHTRLNSKLPVAAISADYASQMTAAGWKLEGRVDDRVMSVTRFSQSLINGDSMTALVALVALPTSLDIDAWMHLVRYRPGGR